VWLLAQRAEHATRGNHATVHRFRADELQHASNGLRSLETTASTIDRHERLSRLQSFGLTLHPCCPYRLLLVGALPLCHPLSKALPVGVLFTPSSRSLNLFIDKLQLSTRHTVPHYLLSS
jgi:hypothetical protein